MVVVCSLFGGEGIPGVISNFKRLKLVWDFTSVWQHGFFKHMLFWTMNFVLCLTYKLRQTESWLFYLVVYVDLNRCMHVYVLKVQSFQSTLPW